MLKVTEVDIFAKEKRSGKKEIPVIIKKLFYTVISDSVGNWVQGLRVIKSGLQLLNELQSSLFFFVSALQSYYSQGMTGKSYLRI